MTRAPVDFIEAAKALACIRDSIEDTLVAKERGEKDTHMLMHYRTEAEQQQSRLRVISTWLGVYIPSER